MEDYFDRFFAHVEKSKYDFNVRNIRFGTVENPFSRSLNIVKIVIVVIITARFISVVEEVISVLFLLGIFLRALFVDPGRMKKRKKKI